MSSSPATAVLGGCDVLHQLKSGGMGEVLLARRRAAGGFEKLVAVKTIRSELRGQAPLRAMFFDEARLLSRLDHPAIAQVHDFGEQDGTLYLVMEYVSGVRFTELIRRRPPPAICARAMAEVCRGLHAAHELRDRAGNPLGVVHRDVSPENLMMTFEGRVKVLDFGIALMRGRQAPVTEYGTVKGKPPYLSPEQIKNQPVDRRSDIFSAAVVLHELLTGEPVFSGDSLYAVARAVEHAEVQPPSALAGPLPSGLDEVVMHGMARDLDGRFPNALALAEALDRVAVGVGGESLESWAARELADARERHRDWLSGILGHGAAARTGRPSGVMTAPAVPAQVGQEPQPTPGPATDGRSTSSIARELRSRGRAAAWVAAVLVLAAALGAVLLLAGRADPASSSSHDVDAGPVAATSPPVDAIVIEPADAAAVVGAHTAADAGVRAVEPDRATRARGNALRPPIDGGSPHAARADAGTAASGYITVAAEPYALVRIDGEDIGSTPIFRRPLPAGRHDVQLLYPDSGAVRHSRPVTIESGKLESIILK